MKVYDYLTIKTIGFRIYQDFSDYLLDNFGIKNMATGFYNLPFTPEQITKYFKGWGINEQKYHTECKNDSYIVIFNKEKIHYFLNHNNLDTELEKITYPIVLNDFIRNCFRYKMELEM